MGHQVGSLVSIGLSWGYQPIYNPFTSTNSMAVSEEVSWIRQLRLHVLLQHARHVLQHLPAVPPGRRMFEALLGERSILPAARHVAAGRREAVHDQRDGQKPRN